MKNNKLLLSLAVIYLLYCFLLGLIAPIFIKPIIPEQAKNFINGEVRVESLSINPFTHAVSLKGVTLLNSKANKLASFDKLSVNIDLLPFILLNADIHKLELMGLQIFTGEKAAEPWLRLPKLAVTDSSIAITQQDVTIKNILLDQLKLSAVLMDDQSTNIQLFLEEIEQLLISESTEAQNENTNTDSAETQLNETEPTEISSREHKPSTSTTKTGTKNKTEIETEEAPWLVHIAHVHFNAASISVLDQSVRNEQHPDGVSTLIAPINITLSPIESDLSQDIKLNLDAQLFKGKLKIKGSVHPNTLASQINYSLEALQLSELNAYVEHFSLASITQGSFSTQGQVESFPFIQSNDAKASSDEKAGESETSEKLSSENVLQVKVSNSSQIKMLEVKHQNFDTPFLSCENIQTQDLHYVLLPASLNLDNFLIQLCTVNPYINENGATNFSFTKTDAAEKATNANTDSAQKTPDTQQASHSINIKMIELIDNIIHIEDLSPGKKVTLDLKNFQAKIENLAEGNTDLSTFQLSALLNDHAPLSIQGNGNFLNPKLSTQGNVTLKNLGLKEFSPYALNLSSRPIEKGVLALDIEIKALENKLDSHASLNLLGLDLGKKQNVEGASKLPIGLALGILKDSKGNIHINVPVKGDLDDPTFSITKQVIKTLTGIITKAATAPLSMMGGLVTGGDNTDSLNIIFANQVISIDAKQQKTIAKIANVLKKRPELSIRLNTLLGSNERNELITESQQSEILNARQQSVFNALVAEGVSELQIDKGILDTTTNSEQSQVLLEFFAR